MALANGRKAKSVKTVSNPWSKNVPITLRYPMKKI